MYLGFCRNITWQFVRKVTISASRPTKATQTLVMSKKQSSISSFFKPKSTSTNQNVTKVEAVIKTPTKEKISKNKILKDKENLQESPTKMLKNIAIYSSGYTYKPWE